MKILHIIIELFRRFSELMHNEGEQKPTPPVATKPAPKPEAQPRPSNCEQVAEVRWGGSAKISQEFLNSVAWTCRQLMPDRDLSEFMGEMLSCMAFETGYSFSPAVRNAAGSGATGLIQFMPTTARNLGTTTDKLAKMSQVQQMNFVYKYFEPYKGRLANLGDVYLAIFYPVAMNKPDDWVIAHKGSKVYTQNAGFDRNKKGYITRGDTLRAVRDAYQRGAAEAFSGEVCL